MQAPTQQTLNLWDAQNMSLKSLTLLTAEVSLFVACMAD